MSESPQLYDLYEKISRDLDELGLKGPCRSYVSVSLIHISEPTRH